MEAKYVLVALVAVYQILDVVTTNKALRIGAGSEGNAVMAFFMAKLGHLWWVVKPVAVAFALWQVWDTPLGFYVVVAITCVFYHWVVFFNNLPIIRRHEQKFGK